jgi:hypothetical protein
MFHHEGREDHEGFRRVRFAHRSAWQSTQSLLSHFPLRVLLRLRGELSEFFVSFVTPSKIAAGAKRCDSQNRHPRMFLSGVQSEFRLDSR